MKRAICIGVLVVLSASTGGAQTNPNTITAAEAERRIGAHVKHIETRAGAMTSAYYYSGAQGTLETAFRKAGVKDGMTYADSWGKGGIGLFWSESIMPFYSRHLAALDTSVKNVRAKGSASKADLDRLDAGMKAWKDADAWFVGSFNAIVDIFTKQALIFDKKQANENIFGPRMRAATEAKPPRMDLYDAAKSEWAAANKALDVEDAKLIGEMAGIKAQMAGKAGERFFDVIEGTACTNGTERLNPEIKQTKTWTLAESIEFTKGSAAYIGSDKNVLKTLSTAGEVIDVLEKIAEELKVPVPKIPMKYFKEIIKQGDQIVQAGGKLSAQQQQKLVDLVIRIDLVEVTVECVAVEVCENGKWVRKGMRPQGEPVRKKLKPLIKEEPGVLAGELWRRIEKNTRSYAAMQERFETDPCAGTTPPPPVDQDKKKECDELPGKIESAEEKKANIERTAIPDAQNHLERARQDLADWNKGLKEFYVTIDRRIKDTETTLKRKQDELKRAEEKKSNLDNNPDVPNRDEMLKNAAKRVAEARTEVDTAEKVLAEAKDGRVRADKRTSDLEGMVKYRQEKIDELKKEAADAQAEIERLRAEHAKCGR